MAPLGSTEEHESVTLSFDGSRALPMNLSSTTQQLNDGGAESERVVVIDVGSFVTKAGWASNPIPTTSFPSVSESGTWVVDRGSLDFSSLTE